MRIQRSHYSTIILTLLVLIGHALDARSQIFPKEDGPTAVYPSSVIFLRDTLYVLDSTYIEIDLHQQVAYQHFSNGSIRRFPVSTGNRRLYRGIATRPGIFSIQYKQRRHVSSRFGVPMYYWMPFDGGIGLHALAGDDYHEYLGVEPSSHGCVRMTKPDAESIYGTVGAGTVVFVHDGRPARVLQFASPTTPGLRVMDTIDTDLLRRRLDAVEQGLWGDTSLEPKLALPPGDRFTAKISVGTLRELSPLPENTDSREETLR
jgi:hypothetical protein